MAEELTDVICNAGGLALPPALQRSLQRKTGRCSRVGAKLHVAFIVEGSVAQGDQLKVTAQLIRTEDDFHVWSAHSATAGRRLRRAAGDRRLRGEGSGD
jgi:hypothetical protein